MASPIESSLISKLEARDVSNIYLHFSDYLRPFADLDCRTKTDDKALSIRSLADKFFCFLDRSLSILPTLLSDPLTLSSDEAAELFKIYRLCLKCLESLLPQLSCKPYIGHIHRIRMAGRLERWRLYNEAEIECLRILESLRGTGSHLTKSKGKILPDVNKSIKDSEFGSLVVESVIVLAGCAAMNQTKESEVYNRILRLLEEVRPWYRILDDTLYVNMHKNLLKFMGKCALFLIEELIYFNEELANSFCLATIREYAMSSMEDQVCEFAYGICSSLFSSQQSSSIIVMNIIVQIFNAIATKSEAKTKHTVKFLRLISYCVYKCRRTNLDFCSIFARCLEEMAGDYHEAMSPFELILNLYALGLKFILSSSRGENHDNDVGKLLEVGDRQKLATLISLLRNHFHFGSDDRVGTGQYNSQLTSDCGASIAPQSMDKSLVLYCFDALEVSCQLLAEIINREREHIITNDEATSFTQFCNIKDTFFQYRGLFFCYRSFSLGEKVDLFNESKDTIFEIAVAAFTLSLKTESNVKSSVNLIKHIIESEWVQLHGLQHLYTSLYKIAKILYKNKQLKKASKSLKLCCRASWTYVIHLCRMRTTNISSDITNIVNETCTRTIFLVKVVHECGNKDVKRIIIQSLEDWFVANSLFKRLPVPAPLVKVWVKAVCRSNTDMDLEVYGQSMYSFLCSTKLTKRLIELLLEQEIDEYEELSSHYPAICLKMQMEIINILMREVYVDKSILMQQITCFQKAKLMIKKARIWRVHGSVKMEDCIHCLGDAISIINEYYDESLSHAIFPCHQLAVAYCLRAICTQEAKSNSKQLLEDMQLADINAAIKIWLNIFSEDPYHSDDTVEVDYMMLLLCNVIDLLSIKCFFKFHQEIYFLMIRLFKHKNIPLERFVAILWGSRRTSHGLCVSPINEAFQMSLFKHLGESPQSINFWTNCLRESRAMLGRFQQNFFIFCKNSTLRSCSNENFQLEMTIDEVKEAASKLISTPLAFDYSVFVAGSLYYTLCERHISNGRLLEAFCCAMDAHRLHKKLFAKKFIHAMEQKNEKDNKAEADLANFRVYGSSLLEIWSFNNNSWDFEGYLSPWNVLQSYLESTLQVGIIQEIIGNSAEAEKFLLWGKNISCIQGLPIFIASFSNILGKLYHKKQRFELAENELYSVQEVLTLSRNNLSCLKCQLTLEVTVNQHLGDLFQSNVDVVNTPNICVKRLTQAEDFYRFGLNKSNNSGWKNSVNNVEEESGKDFASVFTNYTDSRNVGGSKANLETKNSRKAANARKASKRKQTLILDTNTRVTRSKCQPSTKEFLTNCTEGQECLTCWHCLCMEVMKFGLIDNFINLKWEFIRRRLLVRLLIGLGTCLGNLGKVHEMHEHFLKGLSALASKTLYDNANNSLQPAILLELIDKEFQEDVFAIERAELLYITSWFLLKSHPTNVTGVICCNLSQVQFATLVSWLKLAFILCREVPTVLQKVSRLLTIVYVASSSSDDYFSLPSQNTLFESHWASFFHQASLGIHLNYQFHSNITERCKGFRSTDIEEQICSLLRIAPESICDLEEFVMKFFERLPCATTLCVTLLEKNYSSFLQDSLIFPSRVRACMLLSRFNSKNQPLVMILPVDTILRESLGEVDLRSGFDTLFEGKDFDKDWQCPWGFSVVDDIVPEFRMILKENYGLLSSLDDFTINTELWYKELWWRRTMNLDDRLQKLLRTIEDSWFGPWRIMLMGDRQPRSTLDSVCHELLRELKLKAKIDVNESLLKVILGGSKDDVKVETFMSELCSQLCSQKGCYVGVGRGECCDEGRKFGALHPESSAIRKTSALSIELICEAISQLEEDTGNREPIILVLDCEVQMLPLENVPIMRNQEVYRMPSVGSISMIFDRSKHRQTQDNKISFPMIDPFDAFYLLNPSGDLSSTQNEFENWFKDQHWEGKAGSAPTAEELVVFLKSHDLFIYFGHGSGKQFISEHKIQKLKNCAASFLMGCGSGSLKLNGSYAPEGTPLSYLQGGSPFIVATLWGVIDKDINRFAKAMLDAWFRERSYVSVGFCSKCKLVSKKLKSSNSGSKAVNCNNRPKIGSFMSEARGACTLQFLTGASTVCYGVPTGIWRKKDNEHIKK